jgi:hypothetical protein
MRQRRVAADSGLNTGLIITLKYVRRTASGDAGSGLGNTIKYLRRTKNSNRHVPGFRPTHIRASGTPRSPAAKSLTEVSAQPRLPGR